MLNKTDMELKQLALDIKNGLVFSSLNIRKKDLNLIGNIFMVTLFMDYNFDDVGMLYEYYEKAMSVSINGYPSFFSCYMLNKSDTEKLCTYVDLLTKQEKEFLHSQLKKETDSSEFNLN